ncbi:MAG TPA: hypothetical protein VGJ53_12630 [Micromonosporaceae bacterium]
MPTSVLLAVLAAAGLLALAPALVRRYDATERLVAERAQSTARVLERRRRHRSVPGRRPVNAPGVLVVTLRAATPRPSSVRPVSAMPVSARPVSARPVSARPYPARRRPRPRRGSAAMYRRRRVLASLVLLNAVELAGVAMVGPGFWVSVTVTATLLVVYIVHLRNRALEDRRRRRVQAREAALLAAWQAEVRREQVRRAAARREVQRRLAAQREAVRRAALGLDRDARGRQPSVWYRGA